MRDSSIAEDQASPQPHVIIAAAARGAVADMRAIYTPVTWTVGWLGRIIMQVIFFALVGVLLGSPEAVVYLFVGQAVMATVSECFMAIPSTTWERKAGTLALLTSSPGPQWPVFFGRSLQWLPSGVATASVVLLVIGPFFGVHWSLTSGLMLVPALVLVAVGAYAMALAMAAVVLRAPRWRNLVSNIAAVVTMILSGATVPVSIWPVWLQAAGQLLPVTHALSVVRALQAGNIHAGILQPFGFCICLTAVWYLVAALGFAHFTESGRRSGSIDFEG